MLHTLESSYIGVINYRKTNRERKRVLVDDEPAPTGDLRVRTKMVMTRKGRPGSEWIVGYNGDHQIVSDEDFLTVAMARSSGRNTSHKVRSSQELFAHPVCDCPGRRPDQKYHISWWQPAKYKCSQDLNSANCLCRVGSRILVEDVQRAVYEIIRKSQHVNLRARPALIASGIIWSILRSIETCSRNLKAA